MDMTRYRRERRLLQLALVIAACVPVIAGAGGMVLGSAAFGGGADANLDSHVRYLSGLLFGIGISFWIMVPTIERHAVVVRALTLWVVIGGIARLLAAITIAMPSVSMQLAIGMELIVTPLLCVWQARIARFSANT